MTNLLQSSTFPVCHLKYSQPLLGQCCVLFTTCYFGRRTCQSVVVNSRFSSLWMKAHRFVPEGGDTSAHRTLSMIAKEGRKYGTGLMLVTQRPSEIDSAILSQCGSLIALRLTNSVDRSKVSAAVPDDLGGLIEQLPLLRTGGRVYFLVRSCRYPLEFGFERLGKSQLETIPNSLMFGKLKNVQISNSIPVL